MARFRGAGTEDSKIWISGDLRRGNGLTGECGCFVKTLRSLDGEATNVGMDQAQDSWLDCVTLRFPTFAVDEEGRGKQGYSKQTKTCFPAFSFKE